MVTRFEKKACESKQINLEKPTHGALFDRIGLQKKGDEKLVNYHESYLDELE